MISSADYFLAVRRYKQKFLRRALQRHDWNVAHTAKAIGMNRTNLHKLMLALQLRRPAQPHKPYQGARERGRARRFTLRQAA